tara:strand:- start:10476 stop:10889 length:414 start_codon:yes stop_codon:yes gene_type:complete
MPKVSAQREALQFSLRLQRLVENVLPERINEAKKVVALDALRGIVLKNPVDTSRSQSNWNVTLDTPSDDADYKRMEDNPGGVIARGASTIDKARIGTDIWITNNIDYIVKLEHGHSRQAPNGMVRPTLEELRLHYNA